jgi:acetyl esterase
MFNECYVNPARAKEKYASPIFCVIEDLRGSPPALLSLAGKDSLFEEGRQYAKTLKLAGVDVTSIEYADALHGFTMGDSADAKDAIERMACFLLKHLRA